MSIYKITNRTNLVGKRDFKFNSELDITVVENMVKRTMKLKPGDSVFLTVASLPLSVHRLRVKGLVTVVEVSPADLPKKASKPKAVSKKAVKPKPTTIEKKTIAAKKKPAKTSSAKTTSKSKVAAAEKDSAK